MNRWEKAAKGSFESAVASELMKSEKPGTIITLQKCPFALTAPKQSTPSSIPEPVLSLVALAPMDPGHLQSFLSLYEDLFRRYIKRTSFASRIGFIHYAQCKLIASHLTW
ncbi:hypothetical protein WG66_009176 [Moniliophthora roreri]|nr:hypothetical protein WG66_009176 [Moniliophthora roreri]